MRYVFLAAVAVVTVASSPSSARAQTHGVGFPIGEKSRIHTDLDLAVGFDSNPDRFQKSSAGDVSDWKGLIRPGISVDVPGSALSLNLRSQLSITQYFGTGAAQDTTTFGGLIMANARVGEVDAPVGFVLQNTLVRTPSLIDELGTIASDERRFKEWSNRGQASLALRPGGGALEFDLGYLNELSVFDHTLPDSQRHGALLEAKLRFLPKTALVFHSDFSFFDANDADSTMGTLKSTPYNISVGLIGQITNRLSADVEAGFGDSLTWTSDFFSSVSNSNTRTVIGRAELAYDLFDASRISIGYRRQVRPVILFDSFTSDALMGRFVIGLGSRLSFGLFGQYEWRSYAENDSKARLFTGDARLEYWFFEFLSAALDYRLLAQNGSASGSPASGVGSFLVEDYTRHQALMFVGLKY